MKWISVKDKKPPPRNILVYGKCGMPHVAMFDYDDYFHTEACLKGNTHFTGEPIEFTHWMKLPEPPIDGMD